jgi:hypothetical protein
MATVTNLNSLRFDSMEYGIHIPSPSCFLGHV